MILNDFCTQTASLQSADQKITIILTALQLSSRMIIKIGGNLYHHAQLASEPSVIRHPK